MTILCDNSFLLNIFPEHILIRKEDLEVMPYKALTVSGKTCFLKKGRPAPGMNICGNRGSCHSYIMIYQIPK